MKNKKILNMMIVKCFRFFRKHYLLTIFLLLFSWPTVATLCLWTYTLGNTLTLSFRDDFKLAEILGLTPQIRERYYKETLLSDGPSYAWIFKIESDFEMIWDRSKWEDKYLFGTDTLEHIFPDKKFMPSGTVYLEEQIPPKSRTIKYYLLPGENKEFFIYQFSP